MKTRVARKIVKAQEIRCRPRFNGPATLRTAGRRQYGEVKYRKALHILLKKLDRETAKPTKGSIERCAEIYREMNAARIDVLISRSPSTQPSKGSK